MTSDAILRLRARHYQRYALMFLTHQPLLRQIFEFDAKLSFKRCAGVTLREETHGGISGLRIVPTGGAAQKLLYLHGGGFTIGSPHTHKWMVARLCKEAGCEAFIPNYRKAPEHPFPAAQEDALAAFDGYAPDFVGGDSAGGCLSLYLSANRTFRAMLLLSPIGDQSRLARADFSRELLIPPAWAQAIQRAVKADPLDVRASPLLGDLSNAPPTLIQVSPGEVLEPDAHRAAEMLPEATLSLYDGVPHVWQLHAGKNATADRAISEAAAFLAAR